MKDMQTTISKVDAILDPIDDSKRRAE